MVAFLKDNFSTFALVISGLFVLFRWLDQRRRELQERRFEQYWKLVNTSVDEAMLMKQEVSLLLLRRYPEFREETISALRSAQIRGGPWVTQNAGAVETVLDHFKAT